MLKFLKKKRYWFIVWLDTTFKEHDNNKMYTSDGRIHNSVSDIHPIEWLHEFSIEEKGTERFAQIIYWAEITKKQHNLFNSFF